MDKNFPGSILGAVNLTQQKSQMKKLAFLITEFSICLILIYPRLRTRNCVDSVNA